MFQRNFSGRRGPPRFRGKRNFNQPARKIDVSRFINNAVEKVKPVDYVATNRFEDFAIEDRLKRNIAQKGYVKPTPIQDQTIPHILAGKDIVGIANTGTGKTAAFLLPFLNKVIRNRSEKVLILAPTRELALQIQQDFFGFAQGFGLFAELCIGGASIGMQIRNLRRNPNFIIGTPGRIKDLIQRRVLNLSFFRNVVLDEADRMLDMGFLPDIKYLLALLPSQRHSLFFSATISPQIETLIRTFLKDPLKISVKVQETAANVQQDVIRVSSSKTRITVLQELLTKKEFNKVLVFGKTKHGVEKLAINLAKSGFRVASLHGNKSQSKRQMALTHFKLNKIQVLVATDVAARGLDIADVSHVINFDLPATYDDYVHRIGRTGRADKKGVALTFVD